MIYFMFLNFILFSNVILGFVPESNEEFDPIINYLLNGNDTDISGLYMTEKDDFNYGGEPIFSEGIWKCGICDKITDSKLIYSETNEVDTNIEDEDFIQVQVGLSFDEMRCVTIQSDQECMVARAAGDCAGPTVSLIVADSQRFIVRVFGE